jgi:ABC-type multidrug transport system ATPase subunit
MKQRVKILLALMSEVPLLLLDEPAMNLDSSGIAWYHNMIGSYAAGKTVVVCSNMHQTEAGFASRTVNISDFRDTR